MLIEIEGRYINPDKIVYVTKTEWASTWKIVIRLTDAYSVQIMTNSEEEADEKIQIIINKINSSQRFNNNFTREREKEVIPTQQKLYINTFYLSSLYFAKL